MRKLTLGLCLLSLGTSASAQTASSIQSDLQQIGRSTYELLRYITGLTISPAAPSNPTLCSKAGSDALALSDKVSKLLLDSESFFKSNNRFAYMDTAADVLQSAALSLYASANKACSTERVDRDLAALHLQTAGLKIDIVDLYMLKAER